MKKVIRVGTFQRQEVLLTVQKQFVGNALHQWSNTRLYLAGTKGQHQTAGEGMQDTSGDGERTPPEDTRGDAQLAFYLQGCEDDDADADTFTVDASSEAAGTSSSGGTGAACGGAAAGGSRAKGSTKVLTPSASELLGMQVNINQGQLGVKKRRKDRWVMEKGEAKMLDSMAQELCGQLCPRRIAELRGMDTAPIEEGDKISCREEVKVRTAEFCELAQKDFVYTNGTSRGVKGSPNWVDCEHSFLKFVAGCKHEKQDCMFIVKVCPLHPRSHFLFE
jgi:hypothetical protein